MCREKPDTIVIIKHPKTNAPDIRIALYSRGKQMAWRYKDKMQPDTLTPTDLGRRLGTWIGSHDPLCGK